VISSKMPSSSRALEAKKIYNHVARFAKSNWSTSAWEIGQTLFVLAIFFWLNKWWLSIFSGLAFLRLFIQFHDMAHFSFFPSARWNQEIGTILGGPCLTPFSYWKRTHDHHHQHSNDLNFLQTSQTCPITLKQYQALSPNRQRLYSFFTSRPMMMSVSPILIWVMFMSKYRRNDIGYWLAYVISSFLTGRFTVSLLSAWVGAVAGVYLFHMQHTFMPTTRVKNKDYFENGLYGSSIIDMPELLKWFSCGIEYHHIHHLNAKVPSFRMRSCHEAAPSDMFKEVHHLDLVNGFDMLQFNVWDEDGMCFQHAEPTK